LEGGMRPQDVVHFATRAAAEAANLNGSLFASGDLILVKASRGMQLEKLVGGIRTRFAIPQASGSDSTGGSRGPAMACYAGWEVV
jgi:hypothetical protein